MNKRINIFVFIGLLFSLGIIFLVKEDELLSYNERRYLTQKADLSFQYIKSGEIVNKFEAYALDQFPFRDELRAIKTFANYNIFMRIENNNVVVQKGSMFELKSAYNYDNARKSINIINSIATSKFYENNCYFALIPDKSCFLDMMGNDYDYAKVEAEVKKVLHPRISYIPIGDTLSYEAYYKTDLHWSQYKILDTKNRILDYMGNQYTADYETQEIPNYIGSYGVKSESLSLADTISYLSNQRIKDTTVYNYETRLTTPVYDLSKLEDEKSLDKYDIFLSGASPILQVKSPYKTGKTLLLFRDSFGSSVAPFFLEYYDTIYLVDLRYIDSSLIENYIEIKPDYDILFLYNTSMLEITGNFK